MKENFLFHKWPNRNNIFENEKYVEISYFDEYRRFLCIKYCETPLILFVLLIILRFMLVFFFYIFSIKNIKYRFHECNWILFVSYGENNQILIGVSHLSMWCHLTSKWLKWLSSDYCTCAKKGHSWIVAAPGKLPKIGTFFWI